MSTEYIERGTALETLMEVVYAELASDTDNSRANYIIGAIENLPAADVVPVVRCEKCKHGISFERNAELDSSCYLHCAIYRGEEVRNVWHKYKKYYRDYSVVDRDGFCDQGVAGEPCMDERSDT